MIVADDSMAPEYRPGEILRLSINVQPWDGCTVAAVVGDARTPVLRYYRERGNGSFDLWPENPNFQPVTANASMQIDIKGVVVRHVRSFEPPAQ